MDYYIMEDEGLDQIINDKDSHNPQKIIIRSKAEMTNAEINRYLLVARQSGRIKPKITKATALIDSDIEL